MTEHIPWQLALESVAYVPHTLGFTPTESFVVITYNFADGYFHIGPSARIDLGLFDAEGGGLEAVGLLDRLSSLESEGAVLLFFTEREEEFLAGAISLLGAAWPFVEHGGSFRVLPERIQALGRGGQVTDERDAIELSATKVAMTLPPARGEDETALRFPRKPSDGGWEEGLNEIAALDPERILALWSRSLKRAVRSGEIASVRAQAACIGGLNNPIVRDGFLGWVLGGTTSTAPLDQISPMKMVFASERPDRQVLEPAIEALAAMALSAPQGLAASPIACAAYLSWYSGWGARARILATQALEENPAHTLAILVLDIVSASCPPPWVSQSGTPWLAPA